MKTIQVKKLLPRKSKSHKYHYGQVLHIGGLAPYGGAIKLSSSASLYSGCGLVMVATDSENISSIHAEHPEIICFDIKNSITLDTFLKKADVIVLGPGLGVSKKAESIFENVLSKIYPHQILILDASALSLLSNYTQALPKCQLILTPHLGEWKTLSKVREYSDIISWELQKKYSAFLVVKGPTTKLFYHEDLYLCKQGNPYMAVGGMGDVLSGIIAGLIPQYESTLDAIMSAIYLHSLLGDQIAKEMHTVLPSELINRLPSTILEVLGSNRNTHQTQE